MALYRVDSTLSRGEKIIRPGSVSRLQWMEPGGIEILERLGKIHKIRTPPLAALAGWQTRANRLARVSINTIDDFLDADPDTIRTALRVKKETVEKYRSELLAWGTVDAPPVRE